jgi:hypothetical protein
MPSTLSPLVLGARLVDKVGGTTLFFLERWQQLIGSFQVSPNVARTQALGLSASLPATTAYIPLVAGLYRVNVYLRKTAADGVSSSLTLTIGWTESGVPLTQSFAALTTDTTGSVQATSFQVWSDASAPITTAVVYASNTPGAMQYREDVDVEQKAA